MFAYSLSEMGTGLRLTGATSDLRDIAWTGDETAVRAIERVTHGLLAHRRDTAEALEALLAHDPGSTFGHAIRGFATWLLMRTEHAPTVQRALGAAEDSLAARDGTDAERALVLALRALSRGRPLDAIAVLDARVEQAPTDLAAMKLGHALHFLVGDTEGLARTMESVITRMPRDLPGRGFALGCAGFARIERGEVEGGERLAREGVMLQPDDAWGAHAVAHALSTRLRPGDAAAWLVSCAPAMEHTNNFGGHLAWHEALCRLAIGEDERALALYDERVVTWLGRDYRDFVNAITLLHRLRLRGHDVRTRLEVLAAEAEKRVGDHGSAFADTHHVLALAETGVDRARAFAASMRAAATERDTHDARVAREVGCDLADAIVALFETTPDARRHARDRFEHTREGWPRLGGSRLQRAIFTLLAREAHE